MTFIICSTPRGSKVGGTGLDWPSNEDGPLENPADFCFWSEGSVHKRNLGKAHDDVMMIMRNADHNVSKRPSNKPKYSTGWYKWFLLGLSFHG
jgi:hypothetical protein